MEYSPERRTALVLCGTGAHGAYHAGAIRAIQEAGVKIDLVAGHGVGAASAALTAIDGASALWDANGIWRSSAVSAFYRWRTPLRISGWLAVALTAVVASPLLFLAAGLIVYPLGFLLEMLGASAGVALVGAYSSWLQSAFTGTNLPTIIPRAAMIVGAAIVLVLLVAAAPTRFRSSAWRQSRGRWWWAVVGAPLDAASARRAFADAIWHLIRGAAPLRQPDAHTLGRRYGEALAESLGQPGVRELVIIATDLDARQDLVAALLREPYRAGFFAARPDRERQAEALDLSGSGRDHAFEVVAGALTPAFGVDPQLIRFAPDGYWRGETHRLCDRPGSVSRLLEELHAAGVEQAVLVSAVPVRPSPHRLSQADVSLTRRMGDVVAADEAAALRDAVAGWHARFAALYVVSPAHNAVGPFDFDGAYDQASDRTQTLLDLVGLGHDDARRQFIEPVVGASGEHLDIGDAHDQGVFDEADSRG